MTAQFTAEEILDIVGGRLAAGMMADEPGRICTDTRQVGEGDWYLALSGEKFDGHDFLGDAFSSGAIGAIVEERTGYAMGNQQFPLLAVDNTLEAYHALARNWRRRINPLVIGVTGSSGKTTTKEMCAATFSSAFRCHKSRQNENNEFGVPRTILSMPEDTEVLIIEMAMRGLGQIEQLARCAVPEVGIITNAGTAHLELLGSIDNIAKAKCELLAHLDKRRHVAIIGQPTATLMKAVQSVYNDKLFICNDEDLEVISVEADTTSFRTKDSDTVFSVRAHGRPLLEDAWCAVMAARYKGMDENAIVRGLRTFEPVGGRGNRLVANNGALVLDETYNANPDSVKASVEAMLDARAYPHGNKIVVLGILAELGPTEAQLHRELGLWLKDKALHTLITVGPLARNIAEGAQGAHYEVLPVSDHAEAERELRKRWTGDACVLIKGSRRAALDKVVSSLLNQE
jgi:UDP-N-acetylmuramoyl-tripeptide--D-alanyl-D-alanine ligase